MGWEPASAVTKPKSIPQRGDAMDDASKRNHIDVLNWWLNSGLELKYSDNVADKALDKNRTNVLNWWLDADLFEKIDQSIN